MLSVLLLIFLNRLLVEELDGRRRQIESHVHAIVSLQNLLSLRIDLEFLGEVALELLLGVVNTTAMAR